MSNLDDLADCIVTFEQTKERLENIEQELAKRLNIKDNIRETLIKLDMDNKLIEDELVAEWYCAYSSYLDYLER